MKNDTTSASISDDYILHLFHLQKEQIDSFQVNHQDDGVHVRIKLTPKTTSCPVCGFPTSKVKSYVHKRITHSMLNTEACYIDYQARRYICLHVIRLSMRTILLLSREWRSLYWPYIMSFEIWKTLPIHLKALHREIIYPLLLPCPSLTGMSRYPEENFLNIWISTKSTVSNLKTVPMYVSFWISTPKMSSIFFQAGKSPNSSITFLSFPEKKDVL